jgi:hypothetical protein
LGVKALELFDDSSSPGLSFALSGSFNIGDAVSSRWLLSTNSLSRLSHG